MPPDWWYRRYLRMTRTADYKKGKRQMEHERRRGLGLDAAVPQDGDDSTQERSVSHE